MDKLRDLFPDELKKFLSPVEKLPKGDKKLSVKGADITKKNYFYNSDKKSNKSKQLKNIHKIGDKVS